MKKWQVESGLLPTSSQGGGHQNTALTYQKFLIENKHFEKQGLCPVPLHVERLGEVFGIYLTFKIQIEVLMEWLWITLGIILVVVGIVGSLLPLIPGPPIAYAGLLIQLFRNPDPFTSKFLWIWAGIVVVSLVLDYMIPIWGTKKFGGTKYGVWGCTIGFLLAFWMGPWGIIIGPFLGAFAGEMIAGQGSKKSFKAALGSFVGFLLGSFLKLVICFMMLYYVIASI